MTRIQKNKLDQLVRIEKVRTVVRIVAVYVAAIGIVLPMSTLLALLPQTAKVKHTQAPLVDLGLSAFRMDLWIVGVVCFAIGMLMLRCVRE